MCHKTHNHIHLQDGYFLNFLCIFTYKYNYSLQSFNYNPNICNILHIAKERVQYLSSHQGIRRVQLCCCKKLGPILFPKNERSSIVTTLTLRVLISYCFNLNHVNGLGRKIYRDNADRESERGTERKIKLTLLFCLQLLNCSWKLVDDLNLSSFDTAPHVDHL